MLTFGFGVSANRWRQLETGAKTASNLKHKGKNPEKSNFLSSFSFHRSHEWLVAVLSFDTLTTHAFGLFPLSANQTLARYESCIDGLLLPMVIDTTSSVSLRVFCFKFTPTHAHLWLSLGLFLVHLEVVCAVALSVVSLCFADDDW